MTTPDTKAIRAQMEALSGFAPGPWKVNPTDDTTVITHDRNMVAEIDGDYNEPDLWPIMEANARLIAAAPDMRETILALCDALDDLRADNERLTAELVSLVKAAKDVGTSFRKALDRAEKAEAENERLRSALSHVVAIHDHSMHDADTNADDMARCARAPLGQEGDA